MTRLQQLCSTVRLVRTFCTWYRPSAPLLLVASCPPLDPDWPWSLRGQFDRAGSTVGMERPEIDVQVQVRVRVRMRMQVGARQAAVLKTATACSNHGKQTTSHVLHTEAAKMTGQDFPASPPPTMQRTGQFVQLTNSEEWTLTHLPLHGTFPFFSIFACRCKLILISCARVCAQLRARVGSAGLLWVWRMACRQNKGVRKGKHNPIISLSGDLHPPRISFTGISLPHLALAPAARHARKHRHDILVLHSRTCWHGLACLY